MLTNTKLKVLTDGTTSVSTSEQDVSFDQPSGDRHLKILEKILKTLFREKTRVIEIDDDNNEIESASEIIIADAVKIESSTVVLSSKSKAVHSAAEDDDSDSEVIVPKKFFTVEYLALKYFLYMCELYGYDKSNFMIAQVSSLSDSSVVAIGAATTEIEKKSRNQLIKERRVLDGETGMKRVDLKMDAAHDADAAKNAQIEYSLELKSISQDMTILMEFKLFDSPEVCMSCMRNIVSNIHVYTYI